MSAQPTEAMTNKLGGGEEEEGRDNAPMMPPFVRRGEEKEGRMIGRTIAQPTQTSVHDDVHDDEHEMERKSAFVSAISSTFAKPKATERPTSTATATPATVAVLVAAAGSRRPVPFERQHQHVPLQDKIDHFHGRRDLGERQGPPRSTYVVVAGTLPAGSASSISGRPTAPDVTAIPKPWTLRNTMGIKTAAADASKGNGVFNHSRSRAAKTNRGMVRRSARETSSRSGCNPDAGDGVQRWKNLKAETRAVKAFRRDQKKKGKQRWAGLKGVHNTTTIFMHALNVGSNYLDDETSSNSSDGQGEGHGDDWSRRRGRRDVGEATGPGGSGSENSSSIWRESSGSDYESSSDNGSFDEEVGGWARGVWVSERSAVEPRRMRKGRSMSVRPIGSDVHCCGSTRNR